MLVPLLLATALAGTPSAPAGYKPTKIEDGCQFSTGPARADGVVPVRADCHWTDVTAQQVITALSDWSAHARYFSSVDQATILQNNGSSVVMHQVHVASGISPRQATLVGTKTVSGGTVRLAWTMKGATQQPLADGNVQCGRDDGYWEIASHPEGGARVTYELEYDPAGLVPGWLVRAFQTGGLVELVGEAHKVAR